MPFFGLLLFLIVAIALAISTITSVINLIKTNDKKYARKLGYIWFIPLLLMAIVLYYHYPITKDRVVGTYQIDTNFYPGANSNWQKEHFSFEITENDDFIFYEKLKDGTQKQYHGKVVWFRNSPPMLYRIDMNEPHPLVDKLPALYRGNRRFYYVFESKFGNMFYRKNK